MRHTLPLAALAAVALALTACSGATEPASTSDDVHTENVSNGAQFDLDDPAHEITVECTDPEALDALGDHTPSGWPKDWNTGDPLPDPECHPEFIELDKWDRRDQFDSCCEGIENGTLVREYGMTDQDVYAALWEQSKARSEW